MVNPNVLDLEIGVPDVKMNEEVSNAISKGLQKSFIIDTCLRWGTINNKTKEEVAEKIKSVVDSFIEGVCDIEDTKDLYDSEIIEKHMDILHNLNIEAENSINSVRLNINNIGIIVDPEVLNYFVHFANQTGYSDLVVSYSAVSHKTFEEILSKDLDDFYNRLISLVGQKINLAKVFSDLFTSKTTELYDKLVEYTKKD